MFSLTGSNGGSSSSDGGNGFCIKFDHNNSLKDKNGCCMVSLSYDFTVKLMGWAHAPRLIETFIQCAPFLDLSGCLLHRIR